jgi:hypothetical protein
MHRSGQVVSVFSVFIALASRAFARIVPEASLSGDGQSLSVNFTRGNKTCKYNLVQTNHFALDAKITKHTEHGVEQQLSPISRTFTSRESGRWATAILDGSTDSFRLEVSGLFVCEGVLIDIPSSSHDIPTNDSAQTMTFDPFDTVQNSESGNPRRLRGGRHLTETAASQDDFKIAEETDDWKLQAERSEEWFMNAWNGQKWYPGCYRGDNQLHVFKIGIVADVAAFQKHGNRLNGLIESTIAKSSFIYESQLNIKLEISDLQIYTSRGSAPNYATDECPRINTQLDRLTRGARLQGGAVHLLTGCGQGDGVVGLAYVGSICRRSNTGVNQLHNSMSWLTFAHELGHNFGGDHSFEEGQGRTGGIMDYGDGRLNGEYQFNTRYRKGQMCGTMSRVVNGCGGNFVPARQGPAPSPPSPPATPAPAPPSSGCNDLNHHCPSYEAQGFCTRSFTEWMAANCKRSCNLCGESTCTDDYPECESWGSDGYCAAGQYVSWMHQYCKRTCDTCEKQSGSQELMEAPQGAPNSPGGNDDLVSRSWLSGPRLSIIAILVALQLMSRH